jgi:hypothetical protein
MSVLVQQKETGCNHPSRGSFFPSKTSRWPARILQLPKASSKLESKEEPGVATKYILVIKREVTGEILLCRQVFTALVSLH